MSEWWHGKTPNAITPHLWLSPEATRFMDDIDHPDWNVLEHGSGGSTLWFAKRCKWVLSVENNWKWYEKIQTMTNAYTNISIIFANERLSQKLPNMLFGQFDLLMIDGDPIADRIEWAINSIKLVRPGGWVCFDNCNRPIFEDVRKWLKENSIETVTFDGNQKGTEYLVTDFYRMKS